MVIFAPVTTAPEESTTLPERLPRTDDSADPCATAGTVNAVSSASTATAATILLVIFDSFQNVSPHPLLSWAKTLSCDIENDRQARYSAAALRRIELLEGRSALRHAGRKCRF